jgi:hypothetical protein
MFTRRAALKGSAAAVTVAATTSTALAVDDSDAAVLAAAAEYLRIDDQETALIGEAEREHGVGAYDDHPAYRDAYATLHEQVHEALARLCQTESRSPKGVWAKFQLLHQHVPGGLDAYPLDAGDDVSVMASVWRDLERLAGRV